MPKRKLKPFVPFSWAAVREQTDPCKPQRTRDTVIFEAFRQYVKGNSWFEEAELDDTELNGEYETFRMGWIIGELFNAGGGPAR